MYVYRFLLSTILIAFLIVSCADEKTKRKPEMVDKEARKASISASDSLNNGKSYLPIYSQIYHHKHQETVDLTITVSLRNISPKDSVYIIKADLFDTSGKPVRQFLDFPVYLEPMETVEVIIEELDKDGGTGGNFLFEWAVKDEKNPPLFEAVMISTLGQQGISFTSRAVRIHE